MVIVQQLKLLENFTCVSLDGFVNLFENDNSISVSNNNLIYFNVIPRDDIYEIDLSSSNTNNSSMYVVSNKRAKLNLDSALLWHCRLGHISKKRIEKLQHDGLLDSTDIKSFEKCVSCMFGKMVRKPYSHQVERAKDLLGLIHTDSFWDYALESAARILNMVLTKKVDKTPYEVWHGQALRSLLKVWVVRQIVSVITYQHTNKLEPRSIKRTFVGYPKEIIGYSFYYPPENKVFVARNAEFLENSLIAQEASGSLEDLEIIQEEDMHPCLDTSLNHEVDDQEIDESQSDINPIRRSTRTRHPTDRLCYTVDCEEHKLKILMQSMRDNEVWELVDLPPDGKIVGHKWLFKKKTDMDGAVHTYIRAIRILIAIAAFYDYEIWQMDVKTAFLNGYLNEENPSELHWTTVKNILKYLRNTKDMFLVYVGDTKQELRVSCCTDVGYLTDADDLKSQTGYVFVLNGGAVDWKSTKQSIFATSSTDAEYMAAFDASKEAVWI
ncbi:retrotransposon protein, putative, ty1-copia subclass [Tanacetum coccineum]